MEKSIKLASGDILVCKGKSWLSRAIMKITRGSWSHTALYTEVWGIPSIIEAQKNGVNHKLFKIWQDKWGYDYEVFRHTKDFNQKELMIRAFSKCGETKYDFFTFLRRAFGYRKKRTSNKENEKMICSEYTAWVWNIENGYDMTPQEQYDYLKSSCNYKIVE